MKFDTKIAIAIAGDLEIWQKLNVVAFLTSGIVAASEDIIGDAYKDASGEQYNPLCIQPVIVLQASRDQLPTYLARAKTRGVRSSIYIRDMFTTGHDEANRATVQRYQTADLPLVGIGIRGEKRDVDKIFKGAKLQD